ncbi:MAG: hypothetical protein JWN14_113 [Chthonomonadales bacterium]|nr:hypothetical protein [Chthonomonadales bacterium]
MAIKCGFAALLALVILLGCPEVVQAQSMPINPAIALQYFQEAQAASKIDGGKLWGVRVYGPLLFVDPVTHNVVANQADHEGLLTKEGEVYVGHLPDTVPIANSTAIWGRIKWAMIVWPFLTQDQSQRVKLMTHESFHRIEKNFLLPGVKTTNDHLDTEEGRVWLQLEWRALRQALTASGTARRHAIEDALTFREYRRSLFPDADASERYAELKEGLAEYTGLKLSAGDNAKLIAQLTKAIEAEAARPTFMSSFAMSSGPAYGILLDSSEPHWRKGLTPRQDLGTLLQSAMKIELAPDLKARAEKQAGLYDGEALRTAEAQRAEKRLDQIAANRQRFLAGPTLLIPLTDQRSITVVSNKVVPIDGVGAVYPTSRIVDDWGTLELSKGALMVQNENGRIRQVYLSLPEDLKGRPLKGKGWKLQLASGWEVIPGSREGDYFLRKIKPQ